MTISGGIPFVYDFSSAAPQSPQTADELFAIWERITS